MLRKLANIDEFDVGRMYRVRFPDGLEYDVGDDELMKSPADYYRPDCKKAVQEKGLKSSMKKYQIKEKVMCISESGYNRQLNRGKPDSPKCIICKVALKQDYKCGTRQGDMTNYRNGSHCPGCGIKYTVSPNAPEWQYKALTAWERTKIASKKGVHAYDVCRYCSGTPPHDIYNEVWKCACGSLVIGLPIKVGGVIDHGYDVP